MLVSTILSTSAAMVHDNIVLYIGTNSLGKLGGLLGTETGLDGHGRVNEGDASATR